MELDDWERTNVDWPTTKTLRSNEAPNKTKHKDLSLFASDVSVCVVFRPQHIAI